MWDVVLCVANLLLECNSEFLPDSSIHRFDKVLKRYIIKSTIKTESFQNVADGDVGMLESLQGLEWRSGHLVPPDSESRTQGGSFLFRKSETIRKIAGHQRRSLMSATSTEATVKDPAAGPMVHHGKASGRLAKNDGESTKSWKARLRPYLFIAPLSSSPVSSSTTASDSP